jgi:mRNA interferase RelE/StbE
MLPDRVPDFKPGDREFESLRAYYNAIWKYVCNCTKSLLDKYLTISYIVPMYQLTYLKRAEKALLAMPRTTALLIREKLRQLVVDPHAPNNNVKKLQGREGYRLRVGEWRVIYEIRDDCLIILVLDIGPRGDIYR